MNFKLKSPIFVLLAILSLTIGLTSCANRGQDSQATAKLYQPTYLYLPKYKPLQTKEGVYTPQVEEKWVAGWKYAELEQEAIRLATAVRQLQNEKTVK